MTAPESVVCSRCRREATETEACHGDWEHNLSTLEDALTADQIVWICPHCLTGDDTAAIDEEIAEMMTTPELAADDEEER